jgi:hypothetical protein
MRSEDVQILKDVVEPQLSKFKEMIVYCEALPLVSWKRLSSLGSENLKLVNIGDNVARISELTYLNFWDLTRRLREH